MDDFCGLFLPERMLGLTKTSGRRWAVMQAFRFGGGPYQILRLAREFDRRRVEDMGCRPANDVDGESSRHLQDNGFYAAKLRSLGWTATLADGRWTVVRPG